MVGNRKGGGEISRSFFDKKRKRRKPKGRRARWRRSRRRGPARPGLKREITVPEQDGSRHNRVHGRELRKGEGNNHRPQRVINGPIFTVNKKANFRATSGKGKDEKQIPDSIGDQASERHPFHRQMRRAGVGSGRLRRKRGGTKGTGNLAHPAEGGEKGNYPRRTKD